MRFGRARVSRQPDAACGGPFLVLDNVDFTVVIVVIVVIFVFFSGVVVLG